MEPPTSFSANRKRQRASIACEYCNSKRVKCNAAEAGLPCSNCERASVDCRLIESRRGKRHSTRENLGNDKIGEQSASAAQGSESRISDRQSVNPQVIEVSAAGGHPDSEPPSRHPAQATSSIDSVSHGDDITDRWHHSELHNQGSTDLVTRQRLGADGSRQDLTRSPGRSKQTFHLGYLVSQAQANGKAVLADEDLHKEYSVISDYGLLRVQDAFALPGSKVCLALFKTFFQYVAPHCPIIDRASFIFDYAIPQRPPSWLLLHAVLFMAAGHCDKALLEQDFQSRHHARSTFFMRAKAVYDADHEQDKVVIIQAVFLMSFRWDNPIKPKDRWHWLGIAISLAVTIGMHRSDVVSNLPLEQARLWRRIWWSLYTEDKHAAAALGRPMHTHAADCDLDLLEIADFEGEAFGFGDEFTRSMPTVVLHYPVCLFGLSKIWEKIIEKPPSSFAQRSNWFSLCEGMIQVWEDGLSEHLRLDHPDSAKTIWPSMLHIVV